MPTLRPAERDAEEFNKGIAVIMKHTQSPLSTENKIDREIHQIENQIKSGAITPAREQFRAAPMTEAVAKLIDYDDYYEFILAPGGKE